jgi:hypothetical protein
MAVLSSSGSFEGSQPVDVDEQERAGWLSLAGLPTCHGRRTDAQGIGEGSNREPCFFTQMTALFGLWERLSGIEYFL